MEEVTSEVLINYDEIPTETISSDKDYITKGLRYEIKGLNGLIKTYNGKPNFDPVKPILRSELAEIILGLQQTFESL